MPKQNEFAGQYFFITFLNIKKTILQISLFKGAKIQI
jgi:hypothetical protein